jgi:hypothetical protein
MKNQDNSKSALTALVKNTLTVGAAIPVGQVDPEEMALRYENDLRIKYWEIRERAGCGPSSILKPAIVEQKNVTWGPTLV